ncbi:hypothetical protein ACS0TY_010936 [Phlomoides rotata]
MEFCIWLTGFGGQPSLDDLQCYQKGSYGCKTFSKAQRDYRRNSFTSLEVSRVEEEELEEENALTELFHGFLAIGTLGTEPITTSTGTEHPATPTFSISVDHIAEKETEVTENELRLINDELEKVLGDDMSSVVSSGRNSHVSHCSTGNGAIVCPLQSYLFGSAIGLQDTGPPVRKEQRTSLGELFQKTKQAEESGTKFEKRNEKESDKSAVHVMKKLLKKKIMDSTTAETKLHKILHIFNRKVHPTTWHQSHKPNKNEIKNNNTRFSEEGLRPSAEDIIIYPQQPISKENTWGYKKQSNELWVKTDADYLVLEL